MIFQWKPEDVRGLIAHAKWTQSQLASELGTTQQQVSAYSLGKKKISKAYCQLLSLVAKKIKYNLSM
jgi:DNA-binding transcriptional regulator YiaG